MQYFGLIFETAFEMFRMNFTLFGFTFSFWEVLVFTVVASLVIWILRVIFLG